MLFLYTVLTEAGKVDSDSKRSVGLMARVVERARYLHYSLRTEEAYVNWVRQFVRWSGLRHPEEMGQAEVEAFLSHLPNERHGPPPTHRQAPTGLRVLS